MSWLFETDLIDTMAAPPPDPWTGSPPPTEDWSAPTDSKDADIAYWTFIETIPTRPGPGGGGMTTNSDDVVDDVIVVGDRPPVEYPGFDPNPGGGGGGGEPGGGGGGPTDCGCPSNGGTPGQQADARSRAADGATIVLGQNWENQEYGGFIYRDNATGQLVMGAITGSAIGTWTPTADNMAGIYSYGQIAGIVHSHGPNVPGSFHNYPSSGDWIAFDQLIGMGATNLSAYYIVGEDGQLREYDANNRDHQTPGTVVSGC